VLSQSRSWTRFGRAGWGAVASFRPVPVTVAASTMLVADSARAAGMVTFNVVALVVGVGLIVVGVRWLRRPGAGGGRRAVAIVMIVLGALFLLGLLGSVAGGAGNSV